MTGGKKELLLFLKRILIYGLFGFILLLTIIPLWILIVNATRSTVEIRASFSLLPGIHLIENWRYLVEKNLEPVRALQNSLAISVLSCVFSIYSSMMMAYSLVVYDYRLKKLFFGFIMTTIMLPGQVLIVGYYQLVMNMGLTNTPWALVLPGLASAGTVYFLMSYLKGTIQVEMVEAGRIDGASEFRIFQTLVFPLAKPALGVQTIFCFVGSWNDLYTPSLVLTNTKSRTVTVLLTIIDQPAFNAEIGAKYLCIAFSIVPMLIVFMLFSRFIVDGISLGSVKG